MTVEITYGDRQSHNRNTGDRYAGGLRQEHGRHFLPQIRDANTRPHAGALTPFRTTPVARSGGGIFKS